MALSPDQQAMLQLVLERGQSYADLAELLGGDEAEVRSRARATLEELAGADPDRNVGLTDYLLGQADPIGRADAVRHLKDDPDDLELATELSQKLRLIAPAAELPRLPGEQRAASTSRRVSAPRRRLRVPRPKSDLSSRQSRLLMALGSGALILVVVVLAIAGAFNGGGSASTAGETSTTTDTTATASGCNAANCGHPLTPINPKNGKYHARIPLSDFQVPIAQQAQSVAVAENDAATLNSELQSALQANTPIVNFKGKTVLQGEIPRNPNAETLARVKLRAVGGGHASGTALFASASGQPYVELDVRNLPPPTKGSAYVLWLLFPGGQSQS